MKIIDHTAQEQKGKAQDILGRMSKILDRSSEQQDAQAQEVVINGLQKQLDHHFYMVRNVTLEGMDKVIPLVLVGPPGISLIYAHGGKGMYRAKEADWEELDEGSHKYKPSRPNLVALTAQMAHSLKNYLERNNLPSNQIEPILFFANPGTHVETNRPAVRIALIDVLDRYAVNLVQSPNTLDQDSVQRIALLLGKQEVPVNPVAKVNENIRDAFTLKEAPPEKPKKPVRQKPIVVVDRSESSFVKKIPFTRQQWIWIGVMTLIAIMALVALVGYVLITG